MEDKLLKYLTSDIQKEKIDDVVNKFIILKKVSQNFKSLFEDNEIVLNQKTMEPFYNFLYSFREIYESINMEDFSKDLDKLPPDIENSFWKNIIENFNYLKVIKAQTSFLREMNIESFSDLMAYTFDNYIMCNGILKKYKEWDINKIRIAERTINTFLKFIIFDFNNFETALYDLDLRFQFSKEKYQFIWDLFEKNKLYLMMKQIIESPYAEED